MSPEEDTVTYDFQNCFLTQIIKRVEHVYKTKKKFLKIIIILGSGKRQVQNIFIVIFIQIKFLCSFVKYLI